MIMYIRKKNLVESVPCVRVQMSKEPVDGKLVPCLVAFDGDGLYRVFRASDYKLVSVSE